MDSSEAPQISSTVNQLYFKGPYLRQNWSLPDSIIYYLAKNPKSPKCYQKLIQSCKYFFSKTPVIVCSELCVYAEENESEIVQLNGETKDIDLKNFSQFFWITNKIFIYGEGTEKRNLISSIFPNIYQCDIKYLGLNNQNIFFNELLFLASKADQIFLSYSTVKDDNGCVVSVENIFEACVQVKTFKIDFIENDPSISSKTVKNLLKISHFSSINKILLNRVSEVFDIEIFYAYIKKTKHTFFDLHFDDSISEIYKNRLKEIVDEILSKENLDYKPPMIYFNGISYELYKTLRRIVLKNRNK